MTKKEARTFVRNKSKYIKRSNYLLWNEIIGSKIENNSNFIKAKKVGIYYPINKEFNFLYLMEKYPNKEFYFPKTIKKDLIFIKVNNINELVDGPFNLKEPVLNSNQKTELDLYIVPCVASHKNYRIGHGAGYYDYYFKNNKGYKIGVVHPLFKDLDVEVNSYDIPMDEII